MLVTVVVVVMVVAIVVSVVVLVVVVQCGSQWCIIHTQEPSSSAWKSGVIACLAAAAHVMVRAVETLISAATLAGTALPGECCEC